jgi:L,D-transpeptidase ErfK/SrfK
MSVLAAAAPTPVFATEDWIGRFEYYQITGQKNLLQVARLNGLGYIELLAANPGIDPWVPEKGRILVLPKAHLLPDAPRQGIVINLAEMRLYFFRKKGAPILTFPLGIGRMGRETPTGVTHVRAKRKNPTWIPPASIRAERPGLPGKVPPGPRNPLGDYALDLAWRGYVIHGTNKPYGIGRRVSSGCIRLYPEDIAQLFRLVSVGTPVTIVYQPVKLGWSHGELYMEVHPTAAQGDELEAHGWFTPAAIQSLDNQVRNAAGSTSYRVAWEIVYDTARKRRGVPVRITR